MKNVLFILFIHVPFSASFVPGSKRSFSSSPIRYNYPLFLVVVVAAAAAAAAAAVVVADVVSVGLVLPILQSTTAPSKFPQSAIAPSTD